jgi:hypothetical protein
MVVTTRGEADWERIWDLVHYKCMRLTPEEAADAYAAAERFVRGVEKLLDA